MQPNEAPKWAVHAPQAEPQSTVHTSHKDPSVEFTHAHADGEATIKAGENMVAVTHGLPGSPNVTLHFTNLDADNFSYVVMMGNVFHVNLSAPVTEDVTFTWSADT